jgi:pyruvyltransferase
MKFFNKAAAQKARTVAAVYGRFLTRWRYVNGYWWPHKDNFGDAISPLILQWASGRKVQNVYDVQRYSGPVYLASGSILQRLSIKDAVVWGSGMISSEGRMAKEPKEVLAVRGPLTRQSLLAQGIKCPEVYGDPGLLVRRFFDPPLTKEFELGIVPHYTEKEMVPLHLTKNKDINLIDIQSEPDKVVRELCRCKRILSSSLHGVITADAFGIPSAQFSQSDRVVGGVFKFKDYCESVGREYVPPLDLNELKEIEDAEEYLVTADVGTTIRGLLNACPFSAQ